MPLSEEEQRLLDEMERNLFGASDVHSSRGKPTPLSSRGIFAGVIGVVVGLALLVLGVTIQTPLLGATGFVLMFAGVVAALSLKPGAGKVSKSSAKNSRPTSAAPGSSSRRPGLMNRLEDRWDERNQG